VALKAVASLFCVSALAFAAEPFGTASSTGAFYVDGVAMTAEGISSWPLVAGDELRAVSSPVIIRFQDGSRVTIAEQSRVKLTRSGDAINLSLTGGRIEFNLSPSSNVQVWNGAYRIPARGGTISTPIAGGFAISGPTSAPRAARRPPPPPISSP